MIYAPRTSRRIALKYIVLYNSIAGKGAGRDSALGLDKILTDGELEYYDVTEVKDYRPILDGLLPDDVIVVSGGDGTLNRFVNDMAAAGFDYGNKVMYYATGSGNDFLKDLGLEKGTPPFDITKYVRDLPTAIIKGEEYKVLNGVGFGIDGYVCAEGDRIRREKKKDSINYTAIALKGLAYAFKPVNAAVTVDGVTKNYKKVWLAPSMNGRYFGGGMMIAPGQDRLNHSGTVSVVAVHDLSTFMILVLFPGIFKGIHVKYKKYVEIIEGKEVTVKFDRACQLQIDGETMDGITEYSVVTSAAKVGDGAGDEKNAVAQTV